MVFIGREGQKIINRVKKRVWPKPLKKRFLCGADHRPNEFDAVRII